MTSKKSGILLHITSLSSDDGIGDMGEEAYRFIDFLSAAGQSIWQILPLNITDAVNNHSPYSSASAFAGNPLLISLKTLQHDGLLAPEDFSDKPSFPEGTVDFEKAVSYKIGLLDRAFERLKQENEFGKKFLAFKEHHAYWLDDFALFSVIKDQQKGAVWNHWPANLRDRDPAALKDLVSANQDAIERIKFRQFVFFTQWKRLKAYAQKKNILIFGDLPIYVQFDSSDVWRAPEYFKLDKNKNPIAVAGVPPDYFSATGQRWGNPVYDWDVLLKRKFDWWLERLKFNLELFDLVRIDHFRGLVDYWEIPAEEPTAQKGHWADVPTDEFLATVKKTIGLERFVAEDLGIITDEVHAVMKKYGFPGMKVLMFAFNGDLETHPYLPHNCIGNSVVYTGTHDNNTVLGWFRCDAEKSEKLNLSEYLEKSLDEETIHLDFIDMAMSSAAKWAIIPLQDALGLDERSRMNVPGTSSGNWRWRLCPGWDTPQLCEQLLSAVTGAGRLPV